MPYHYKKFKAGSPEYKKAYAEHMIKKLKKNRKRGGGQDAGYELYSSGGQGTPDSTFLIFQPDPGSQEGSPN